MIKGMRDEQPQRHVTTESDVIEKPQWHRLSERRPQVNDRCIYRFHPNLLDAFGIWSSQARGFWTYDNGLFVDDPERISWRLAMPHEEPSQQPAPATEGSSAPAGELVERVADAIYRNGIGDGFREEARAAIREMAKAAKDQIGLAGVPDSWTEFAEWLEQEANQ